MFRDIENTKTNKQKKENSETEKELKYDKIPPGALNFTCVYECL